MTRRTYPVGRILDHLNDETVAIITAGMEFTVGMLRHGGMTDAEIAVEVQAYTVKRLNDLTHENNGRVRAAVVTDEDAAELCRNDMAHGDGTVVFAIEGELFELCPDCAVRVIDGILRDGRVVSDSNDPIDVEVYR